MLGLERRISGAGARGCEAAGAGKGGGKMGGLLGDGEEMRKKMVIWGASILSVGYRHES